MRATEASGGNFGRSERAKGPRTQVRIGAFSASPLGLVLLLFLALSAVALVLQIVAAAAAAIVYWSLAVAVCTVAFVTERYKLYGPPPT